MADQSETLRKELSTVMAKWRNLFADCIEEGQRAGEINKSYSAEKLAELFSSSWSGAVMRSKTVKNIEPLETFIEITFGQLLKV